ncbi:MAG TPA: deoxyribose-phosphate aldolase [Chloroflexi bacterium]|nr:deoxyribose-phosphate aldolase [Chloroflexota bacterium]HHW86863.1 deoxyribose-phosphate aldolase [Chloroflexota bacterium]
MTLEEQIAEAWARVRTEAPVVEIAPATLTAEQLAALIDHTLLKPEAGEEQIRALTAEAIEFGFASVCVNPIWTPLCAELLAGTSVKTCTVVGFPLGATLPSIKVYEVEAVAALGADEVDMVLAVGRLRDGDYHLVYRDIAEVADAAHEHDLLLKVILETGLLTDEQKVAACVLAQAAGADFVKTATGFSGGGATVADIALMRRTVGPTMGVKAAGGVRTALDALKMVAAGATRIGTSSGVGIMRDLRSGAPTATTQSEGY